MTSIKIMSKIVAGTAIVVFGSINAMAAVAPKATAGTAAPQHAGPNANGLVQLAQRRGRGARGRRGGVRRGGRRGFRGRRGGFRGRRGRGGRFIGPAIGAGIAAIIGGAIANSRRTYSGRWERCDDRFKSFRYSDGTYQPYGGGPRRLCPYLRR